MKKLFIVVSIFAALLFTGCNKENQKQDSLKTDGMPTYSFKALAEKQFDDNVENYINKFVFAASDKEGFKALNKIDGEIIYLTTSDLHYGNFAKKLGIPFEERGFDENGKKLYSCPTSHLIKFKIIYPLELLKSPAIEYYGYTTVIEYDMAVDQDVDVRLTIFKDVFSPTENITQELDIGADGTIEERLVYNINGVVSHEKSPNFKLIKAENYY